MSQNQFMSFLNSLDKGASDRNSITEFLANVLTPGDEMEYVNGQLMTTGGKPVENMGAKTSYGTLGQANFAGNDPVKQGLLSKMTEAPDKAARKFGLLETNKPPPRLSPRALPSSDFAPVTQILPIEVMMGIDQSNFPDKQGFIEYLTNQFNNTPQLYNSGMLGPDALSQMYQAYEIGKMAEGYLG
tara:strand:- start:225 stop:782 length:558 start_codon:yes stop_codon:yes gene_type:complete